MAKPRTFVSPLYLSVQKHFLLPAPSAAARFENRPRSPDHSNYKQVFKAVRYFLHA